MFLLPTAGFIALSRVACQHAFPLDVVAGAVGVSSSLTYAVLRVLRPFHGLTSHPDTSASRYHGRAPRS